MSKNMIKMLVEKTIHGVWVKNLVSTVRADHETSIRCKGNFYLLLLYFTATMIH